MYIRRSGILLVTILLVSGFALAQTDATAAGGDISGTVKSQNMPLPGVTVSAANTLTGQKVITSTGLDGTYMLHVPANGRYVVRAEMPAFAPGTQEVRINAENRTARVDIGLILLSRVQQAPDEEQQVQARGAPMPNRGFQSLAVTQSGFGGDSEAGGFSPSDQALQVPGMSQESATESVSVTGNTANSGWAGLSSDALRQRVQEMREQRQGYDIGGPPGGAATLGGPGSPQGAGQGAQGGPSGAGRSPGGGGPGGGPGGGGPFIYLGGGGRGRFNFNRPHGTIYYTAANSALDAAPYALNGAQPKPSYMQNRFGGSLGGPLEIPHIYKGGQKTFFFINYNGARAQSPYDAFSTVPTDGSFNTPNERAGDFTGVTDAKGNPITLVNPNVPQCQVSACVMNNRVLNINQASQALLQYIPKPNLPGTINNFHFINSVTNNSDDLNLRLVHALGKSVLGPQRRGAGRGGRNNLNIGFHYHSTEANLTNPFPSVGGTTSVRSFDIPVGYVRSFGKLTNNLRFDFNRNRIFTTNLFALTATDPAAVIGGISSQITPFDYGIPNLAFSDFSSLADTNPLLRRDQTYTLSDSMIWSHGKHTWRWGGDFRRIQLNTETASNPRGSFTFTGINSGFDFADFLLGLPQLSTVQLTAPQLGSNNYHFRANSWDLYTQDEWRVRGNLTLSLGLRYEYVSPYSEINNLIANLLVENLFTPQLAVTRALPGTVGLPGTLVRPDRNNFAPRLGIAWKPFSRTVVRAGYGINYNTSAYSYIAQQLAFQPPFSFTQTVTECIPGRTTGCVQPSQVQLGFSPAPPTTITNTYGVDPNYRMGYVQIWNLNIQREFGRDIILNVDYTGTKGTHLDLLQAPNRNNVGTGPLNDSVSPFYLETSNAGSITHAGTVRLRKRLRNGFSVGGSYTYSKSIDNSSSIGGNAVVVAQNAFDLAAERGLSPFDQRHRFVADYLLELPFGHDKRWLANAGPLRNIFGDWQWSGDWTIASGLPFSPRVLGNFLEVSGGTNGTLRPFLTGQPIAVSNPSLAEWFNPNAFCYDPVRPCPFPTTSQFGDAGRNSIEGPASVVFDMALTKVIPLGDVRVLEFRAQAANVFNTPQFTTIDTVVNSPTFGRVIAVGAMRRIQAQARFRF